ncbi:dihydroneopterin aldolase family protein [Halorussus salinisoli]|uniref:dihydroneopterin aldolase family protein n=1 Tax=Halorussus salinisoli TaxID=2558242 RepID=UPI0010C17567|nr:dihydroneopterin aldolase family protein [Halorussus salinisoli]
MDSTDGDSDLADSTDGDSTDPTDGESACFEAGIKFGTLYHQFAGTPVSPESAPSLETAMEEAIENQPFCEAVTVDVLTEKLKAEMDHEYTELTGRFMEVEIVVDREGVEVVTRMEMEDSYPLMKVESVRKE